MAPAFLNKAVPVLLGAVLGLASALPVAAAGTGSVFVSNERTHNVLVYDPANDFAVVADIATSRRPRDLQVNPDKTLLYVACGDDDVIDVIDVATLAARPLDAGIGATHLNPQWSADDRKLYFIGDPDGVANVYRVDLASREVDQITNVATAVSCITPTGPALSVSNDEQALALLLELSRFGEVVESAAVSLEPHAIAQYLRELATAFHTWYHAQPGRPCEPELRRAWVLPRRAAKCVSSCRGPVASARSGWVAKRGCQSKSTCRGAGEASGARDTRGYITSGAFTPSSDRPLASVCRAACASTSRALRRSASSTRNWWSL